GAGREAPQGGVETDGTAQGGGPPDRGRRVGPERRARQPTRRRDRQAAGRSTGRAVRCPRVLRGPRVGMMGDEGELGHVELAEEHRPRLLEPFDYGRRARGHVGAEDARGSAGSRDACGVEQVFHRHGNAVQRTELTSRRQRLLGSPCRLKGVVGGHVEVAVYPWVDPLDALEIGVDRVARRHLPGADPARQGNRGLVAEVVSIQGNSPSPAVTRSPRTQPDPLARSARLPEHAVTAGVGATTVTMVEGPGAPTLMPVVASCDGATVTLDRGIGVVYVIA